MIPRNSTTEPGQPWMSISGVAHERIDVDADDTSGVDSTYFRGNERTGITTLHAIRLIPSPDPPVRINPSLFLGGLSRISAFGAQSCRAGRTSAA